ncbi:hypothetical protein C5C99_01165, partial [Rathayibacter sp. AY1C4]
MMSEGDCCLARLVTARGLATRCWRVRSGRISGGAVDPAGPRRRAHRRGARGTAGPQRAHLPSAH